MSRPGGRLIGSETLCYSFASDWRPGRCVSARRSSRHLSRSKGSAISRDLRVNQMIRIPQVRVVDEEGAQLGVMPTPQALAMAQERGFDLVEVAPMAAPPVVKFLDFGQYKYELTKREKENKRRQRSVTFKEVRLSPKIGSGDFETKVHRAIEFLEDGDRIKVTVRFRGRELTHPELGRNMLARFTEQIKEHGVAERAPLLEGKSMHLTVASMHKPKEHEAPQRPTGPTGDAPADGRSRRAPAADAGGSRGARRGSRRRPPAAPAGRPKHRQRSRRRRQAPAETPAAEPAAGSRPRSRSRRAAGQPAAATARRPSRSRPAEPEPDRRRPQPRRTNDRHVGPQAPAATGE